METISEKCKKLPAKLEFVFISPVVHHPRALRLPGETLTDVLCMLPRDELFRLNAVCGRRFLRLTREHPSVRGLKPRCAPPLLVTRWGWKKWMGRGPPCISQRDEEDETFVRVRSLWQPVPAPVFPLVPDQITGFRDIIVNFPLDGQANGPNFQAVADFFQALKRAGYLSGHRLTQNHRHQHHETFWERAFPESVGGFPLIELLDGFPGWDGLNVEFLRWPVFRSTRALMVRLEGETVETPLEHLIDWLSEPLPTQITQTDQDNNATTGTENSANPVPSPPSERTLLMATRFNPFNTDNRNMAEFMLRTIVRFYDDRGEDSRPFSVVIERCENQRPFRRENPRIGDVLTFNRFRPNQQPQQQQQQNNNDNNQGNAAPANNNANNANNNIANNNDNGDLADGEEGPEGLVQGLGLLRRHPAIGPLAPVDLSPFRPLDDDNWEHWEEFYREPNEPPPDPQAAAPGNNQAQNQANVAQNNVPGGGGGAPPDGGGNNNDGGGGGVQPPPQQPPAPPPMLPTVYVTHDNLSF